MVYALENHVIVDCQCLGKNLSLILSVKKLSQIHFKTILDPQLVYHKIDEEFHGCSESRIVIGDQRQIGCCMVGGATVFRITNVTTQNNGTERIQCTNDCGFTGSIGTVND